MKSVSLLFLCLITSCFSAQDYMDKIALQTCDCVKDVSDTLQEDRMYLELGLCMIKASEPYKKQLKKDHGINFDNIDKEGEALGKLIGIKMATTCPDVLMKMTEKANKKKAEAANLESFTGRVNKIEKDFFVVFSLSYEGKSLKFYWLTNAESNINLVDDYTKLFDKDVKVKYQVLSLFDPKIGEYRNFNVIEKIEQMSR